jgi:signal transduction histidine kinase
MGSTEAAATTRVCQSKRDLPWPEHIPRALGLFALGIGTVVAIQRHEFTSPNWGLLAIVIVITPWILDIFGEPIPYMREHRFTLPLLATWSVLVLGGVIWLVAGYPVANDCSPFLITLLVGEMASVAGPRFGGAVCVVSIVGLVTYNYVAHAQGMYIWGFAFVIGWMGGTAFRRQVQIAADLAEAQIQLSEQAVAEDRRRVARDVHDLIAHSLAVTMLQLSGARLALEAGDTEETRAALEDAEAAGRAAMAEIHRTVGLLGSSDAATAQLSIPSAADLPGLVADYRHAGLALDFTMEGDIGSVPLATGLASYRLVQESLANAVKHAPGAPVRLRVAVTDRDIRISVVNPVVIGVPAGTSGGNGLRGMAERAELLGGVATAGNGDGTWKVEACIPWDAVPA